MEDIVNPQMIPVTRESSRFRFILVSFLRRLFTNLNAIHFPKRQALKWSVKSMVRGPDGKMSWRGTAAHPEALRHSEADCRNAPDLMCLELHDGLLFSSQR